MIIPNILGQILGGWDDDSIPNHRPEMLKKTHQLGSSKVAASKDEQEVSRTEHEAEIQRLMLGPAWQLNLVDFFWIQDGSYPLVN